jgi:uncharacterized membrane protein
MTGLQIGLALGCVFLIAVGQVLFKAVGLAVASAGSVVDARALTLGAAAAVLYVTATLAWIWLLKTAPLSRAYPYMALSFILVPLMSALFYRESLSVQYLIGIGLVVAGIVVAGLDARP